MLFVNRLIARELQDLENDRDWNRLATRAEAVRKQLIRSWSRLFALIGLFLGLAGGPVIAFVVAVMMFLTVRWITWRDTRSLGDLVKQARDNATAKEVKHE